MLPSEGKPLRWVRVKERMKPQDVADLKQLIEFLKEYQVAEFDLDRGDLKIRLKFNQQQAAPAALSDLARLIASAPQGVGLAAGNAVAGTGAAAASSSECGSRRWGSRS